MIKSKLLSVPVLIKIDTYVADDSDWSWLSRSEVKAMGKLAGMLNFVEKSNA